MIGLPQATEIKKIITKKKIFEHFASDMNMSRRKSFDAQIGHIAVVNEISPKSVNIAAGETINSFFVVLVNLRVKEFDDMNISFLSRIFGQHLVLLLEYEDQYKLAIYQTTVIQSDWTELSNLKVELTGLDLDTIWKNIVIYIGKIKVEYGRTLDTQIQIDEQKRQLQQQINALDKKIRKEIQPHKKYDMHQELLKLKNELEDLNNG